MREGSWVVVSNQVISVHYTTKEIYLAGTVSVDQLEPGHWWISRALVDEDLRGTGIGSRLLNRAIEEIRKAGGGTVTVYPGGYGADPERQANFYIKNGFASNGDGGYVMEVSS